VEAWRTCTATRRWNRRGLEQEARGDMDGAARRGRAQLQLGPGLADAATGPAFIEMKQRITRGARGNGRSKRRREYASCCWERGQRQSSSSQLA